MAMQTIQLTEDLHYHLSYYDGHGWEWEGINVFSQYCCERPYPTKDAARNAAVRDLLALLS